MSGTKADVELAKARALAARTALNRTVEDVQDRISPRHLWERGKATAEARGARLANQAEQVVRSQPGAVAGAGAAVALLVIRKPLFRFVGWMFRRKPKSRIKNGVRLIQYSKSKA